MAGLPLGMPEPNEQKDINPRKSSGSTFPGFIKKKMFVMANHRNSSLSLRRMAA